MSQCEKLCVAGAPGGEEWGGCVGMGGGQTIWPAGSSKISIISLSNENIICISLNALIHGGNCGTNQTAQT